MIKKNDPFFKIKRYGYLDACTVDKNYRRKGIAKALTKAAIKHLKDKGIKYIKTNVYIKNRSALKAWEKLNFKPSSINLIKKI